MAYQNTVPNYGGYAKQRSDVEYKYSTDAINNAYGRFISQLRGNRQLGDMTRNFQQSYPTYTSQFTRRGLSGPGVQSGVQQAAMDRYIGNYARDYGRTQQDLTQQLQQYDLSQTNLDAWRQQSLADIEMAEADEIANAAQNILWLRSQLGGI